MVTVSKRVSRSGVLGKQPGRSVTESSSLCQLVAQQASKSGDEVLRKGMRLCLESQLTKKMVD